MTTDAQTSHFPAARTGAIAPRAARIARAFRHLGAYHSRRNVRYATLCAAVAEACTPDAIVAILENELPMLVRCEAISLQLADGDAISAPPAAQRIDGQPVDAARPREVEIPLRGGSAVAGVLRVSGIFNRDERALLKAVGETIGAALIFRRRLQQLETTITYLEQRNSELEALSTADALTGIPNRRAFDTALGNEWRRITRSGGTLSLLLIDIDHFKDFNDGHGHLAGDECLRLVATLLAAAVRRAGDFVARIGGEEFGVVLPDTPADAAERLANDLCERVRFERFNHPGSRTSAHLTVSVGLASARPTSGVSPAELYAEADAALYRAKRAGRDVVSR